MKIHHATMPATKPAHVAGVLAELTGGRVVPLPHIEQAFLVVDPKDPGTAIEIWPRTARADVGSPHIVHDGDEGPERWPHHAYVSVDLDSDAILAIFEREGWPATIDHVGPPGSGFHLVRGWIEGRTCMELASPAQRDEYVSFFSSMGPAR